jgi:pimeloyl-ACP methyl ester carboxylesterase
LNYYEGPDHGPPLILLHGVTGCWQSFLTLIPFFTPHWKVYALDFRGHGKSGRKAGHYRRPDYASDVGRFIDTKIQEPVILLGHSLGGLVSLFLAEERPGDVRAVIAGDTSLRPLEPAKPTEAGFLNTFRQWKLMLEKGLSLTEMSHELGEMVGRTGPNGAPQLFKEYWDTTELRFTSHCLRRVDPEILGNMANRTMVSENDPLPRLDLVTCPVLFLQADPALGALLTDEDLETALSRMPTASAVKIEGAGHGLHREQPLRTAQAALNFLATL